jgi:hypothetical protein
VLAPVVCELRSLGKRPVGASHPGFVRDQTTGLSGGNTGAGERCAVAMGCPYIYFREDEKSGLTGKSAGAVLISRLVCQEDVLENPSQEQFASLRKSRGISDAEQSRVEKCAIRITSDDLSRELGSVQFRGYSDLAYPGSTGKSGYGT